MRDRKDIVSQLCKRELGVMSSLGRYNFKLLKILIYQESTTFQKMWECHSRCAIYYDWFGFSYVPHILYKLPAVPRTEKFEDGLCCQITPAELPILSTQDCYPHCFLAITANNWLYKLDFNTGSVMQRVYLSHNHRFRHIGYETYGHTIVLKSILNLPGSSRLNQASQNRNQLRDVYCVLVFLQLYPIEFIGMMEITKSIFGNDICNVAAMDGLLLMSHQSGFVRLYSLPRIIADSMEFEARLGDHCPRSNDIVGEYPCGLPLNIIVKAQPPVLFEVRCGDNDLQIGGFPWQYIIQPIRNYNTFQVFTLDPPHTVRNGSLSYETNHIEPDRAMFHPDDSGRIIHYSSTEIRYLSLKSTANSNTPVLASLFILSLNEIQDQSSAVMYASSRRQIKRSIPLYSIQEEFQHTLIAFHYEDDLDVMSLLLANPSNASCNTITGRVQFYNNQTGELFKVIHLKETWNEDSEHNLILDCDVLIHIVKHPRSRSTCYVYYLRYC